MEISARRGIQIGLKRYALVVDSGVRVGCLEIWFQNHSVAPVSRSLPHRTRRTGGRTTNSSSIEKDAHRAK